MERCQLFAYCSQPDAHEGVCVLEAQAGMQVDFASTSADIAIAGGAAGPGKTAWLLIEPLRHIEIAGFSALILRKNLNDLEQPGGLWDKSKALYSRFDAEPLTKEYKWRFPSGATIQFGYVNPRTYEQDYQGSEAAYLAFDELTHFTKAEFTYIFGRNRTTCGIRAYTRTTCNPDVDSWVRQLVDWWVDKDGYADPARTGKLRYMLGRSGRWEWADTAAELQKKFPRAKKGSILSATFILGKLSENRFLGEDYEGRLLAQEESIQQRLLGDGDRGGNWNVRSDVGKTFKREWFEAGPGRGERSCIEAPDGTAWVRAWDLAATPEADATSGTSYTAGVRLGKFEELGRGGEVLVRRFYVGDAVIGRWDAGEVARIVKETAEQDGRDLPIWFCKERAGAGKSVFAHFVNLLAGYEVDGDVESGEKATRLGPVAAQAKAGNLWIVKGPWNEEFFRHLYRLPAKNGEDVGDALAAGLDRLTLGEHYSGAEMARAMSEDRDTAKEIARASDFSGAARVGSW